MNKGVFVYYADVVNDVYLNASGVEYIGTLLQNAITTPSEMFLKSASRNPTLLVEVPSDNSAPGLFWYIEDLLGRGDSVDIAQATSFVSTSSSTSARGFNISAYSTLILAFSSGTAGNSIASDSWKAVHDFAAGGGRVIMLGSRDGSYFNSRVSTNIAACTGTSLTEASKPNIVINDRNHPLLKGWKYQEYNFTNSSISRIGSYSTDPIGWVALTTAKGSPILSTFAIGAGSVIWSAYTFECTSEVQLGSQASCFSAEDSAVVQEIVTRSMAFPVATKRAAICSTPIDIILVIDGSGSISSSDFVLIQKFIPAIADRLDMTAARIGVVQFSDDARIEFGLTSQIANISADAAKIRQLGSGTNLAAGLSLAQTELVLHGRKDNQAKQAMLVLSDGNSNKGQDPVQMAAALKIQGYDLYTVGIGDDINATQLQLVASSPTSLHYFKSSEYDQLYRIIDSIVDNSCVVCQGNLDSVVLMDDSASIEDPDFTIMEDFVQGVANGFDLDPDADHSKTNVTTQLGVVAFADTARTIIGLSSNENAIDKAVTGITRKRGNTAIGDAINLGQKLLTAGVRGGGSGGATRNASLGSMHVTTDERSKIIFLLTDGVNNRGADPVTAAANARAAGTIIYAVGVGSGTDAAKLAAITGDAKKVFYVDDFATLKDIQFKLLQRACKADPSNAAAAAAGGRRRR